MVDIGSVRKDMQVIGADGTQVGVVDDIENGRIKLTKRDSADGHHHYLDVSDIDHVDSHVHLRSGVHVPGAFASGHDTTHSTSGTVAAAGATVAGAAAAAAHGVANAGHRAADAVRDTLDGDHNDGRTPFTRDSDGDGTPNAFDTRDHGRTHTTGTTHSASPTHTNYGATHTNHVERDRGFNWIPWVLAGVGALALILLLRSCADDNRTTTAATTTAATAPATTTTTTTTTERVTLPGGGTIDVRPNTLTYDLNRFLLSNEAAPRTFTFDKLNFDTGKATIRAEDRDTITAVTSILKAYPNVKVDVVGFTDASGDRATNERLSVQRANSVRAALLENGIAANRVTARGGGVADNAAGGAQQSARRTDLVVTAR